MKLSPLDIQHQDFDTAMGGFNRKQVRDFLTQVADQLEQAIRDNQQLREELSRNRHQIEELQVGEVELKRAVISAERIANEIKQNATRESELIIQKAQATREQIIRDAESKIKDARAELSSLERESRLFREQFRGLLHAYERSLDKVPEKKAASVLLED